MDKPDVNTKPILAIIVLQRQYAIAGIGAN
jgi:hypothetical protein